MLLRELFLRALCENSFCNIFDVTVATLSEISFSELFVAEDAFFECQQFLDWRPGGTKLYANTLLLAATTFLLQQPLGRQRVQQSETSKRSENELTSKMLMSLLLVSSNNLPGASRNIFGAGNIFDVTCYALSIVTSLMLLCSSRTALMWLSSGTHSALVGVARDSGHIILPP